MRRRSRGLCASVAAVALWPGAGGRAMDVTGIPADATQDSVMASTHELREVRDWVQAAFLGAPVTGRVAVTVRRQDHSVLQAGRSCVDTPLRIGSKAYRHGLGTHAVSDVAVEIPAGARAFRAEVGVDNNPLTSGGRGSVAFVVDIDGREALRTSVVRGGDAPVPVSVALPAGARELRLQVTDGGDGVAHDQADWADARFQFADGKMAWLDDRQPRLLLSEALPFSFRFGGASSREFLHDWRRTVRREPRPDHDLLEVTWEDPTTGLQACAHIKMFKRYPAVDWLLTFRNAGTADSPLLEDVQVLDTGLRSGYVKTPLVMHSLRGDACAESSFTPTSTPVDAGKPLRLAPTGGRPSSVTAFPWWNLQYGDQGVIAAVGWTGQWAASLERSGTGPGRMAAGMEGTRLRLRPGETIRTPRVLVMPWRGDRQRAHLAWRRLCLFHYAPRIDGKPAALPVALQTFDRYVHRPGWATEAGQIDYVKQAAAIGADTLWLDAAWFPGGFPGGVGTWHAEPSAFPNGLKPVGDACAAAGLLFMLWFEPERVAPGSQVARERPEWVHAGQPWGLFALDNPEARAWMTDLMSERIREYGVRVWRSDFNLDPLPYWRATDAPDRQGITEIRYVEGLYRMWDELRERHPGLVIDNCSSGGRRLDLEMCSRALPLWRSDTGCSPGHPEWNQMQSVALSQYVPLHAISTWSPDPYESRSAATAGAALEWDYLAHDFPAAQARATAAEIRALAPYWYGDLYPLTPIGAGLDAFAAWQLHRADCDAGVVLAFRRPEAALKGIIVALRGLDPKAQYRVTMDGDRRKVSARTLTGRDLSDGLDLRLAAPGTSLVVRYARVPVRSGGKRP